MDFGEITNIQLLCGLALALAGVGVGILLTRRTRSARRAHELERLLEESREQLRDYRSQVGAHFQRTSELLQTMTLQYRAIYDHLAEGASALSPEGARPLAAGNPIEPLLAVGDPERAPRAGAEPKREAASASPSPEAPAAQKRTPEAQRPAPATAPPRPSGGAPARTRERTPSAGPPPPPA